MVRSYALSLLDTGMNEFWHKDLGEGITCIDTGYVRPRLAACYLVEAGDQAAFVDCGTPNSMPRVLAAMRDRGIAAEQVAYVIPSHVHLDHAGGAGAMMQAFPNARLVVHPRGARHLIDPSKLIAGVKAVYGETEYRRNFGELVPVPAERVIEAPDGFAIDLDGRRLTVYDSPGHARHHFCVYDDRSQGIFTGDTFGISYREFDTPKGPFLFATSTPVQFDPDAWHRTLDRLLALSAERLYLTHFSSVELTKSLAAQLRDSIDAFVEIAMAEEGAGAARLGNITKRMRSLLLGGLQTHGCELAQSECESLLAMDIDLNAQGLDVWLSSREQ